MKEERKILTFTSICNLFIGTFKLIIGFIFHVNALVADSIYTFSDSITDFIAIFGSKIAGKRPNKYHPYGFGRVEYITNLLIGVILFLVGIFLLFHSFTAPEGVPPLYVLGFIVCAIIFKYFTFLYMKKHNSKLRSPIVEDNMKEAKLDIISSFCIGIVVILLSFSKTIPILKYADVIASLFICILIFKAAYAILKENVLDLLGDIETNEELLMDLKEELSDIPKGQIKKVELIKYGRYYHAHLILILNEHYSLKTAKMIEQQLEEKIKKYKKLKIKSVNIELDIDVK